MLILGPTVIDIVLFGDPVQSIDARVAAFRAKSHVLIAWPVKLDAGLAQHFLNIEASSTLRFCVLLGLLFLTIAQFPLGRIVPLFPTFG